MKKLIYLSGIFFLLALLQACSSHTEAVSQHQHNRHNTGVKPPSEKRKIIVESALKSVGLPYRWGGISPETGFDCSGLIFYTHLKASITTPRTSQDMYDIGKIVSRDNLNPADLVFFRHPNSGKAFHVGIYIGNNTFVHAPGRGRQVTYAKLDNPYFKKYYLGSRTFM